MVWIMTKFVLSFLLIGYVTLGFAQAPQKFTVSSPESAGFSAERLKRVDAILQGMIDQGIAPNAVTFVARKGKLVHYKAFGYKNVEQKIPLQKTDIFRIASQTKAITSVALLILFEEGKFLLDDPVSKYIPAFKQTQVLDDYDKQTLTYQTHPAGSPITIRQLMTHTAGIPYEHPLQEKPEFKVPFFTSTDRETLKEVIPRLAARPLMAEPGSGFVYGLSIDVLGYLVEVLSGMSLAEYMKTRIFDPLGMQDTYFFLPEVKTKRLVELYSKAKPEDKLTLHTNELYRNFAVSGAKTYYSGGAGLVSTVEDYAKFCQMILNGGTFNGKQILSRKTIEMLHHNQIGEYMVWDRKDKFSFGLQLITDQSLYGDNTSVGALTWSGLYCTEFTIDPKEDLILLVFTNVQPYAHYQEFVRKFRIGVYGALH
jgi:CubicO group peptidase (beta-lactamase class C family)